MMKLITIFTVLLLTITTATRADSPNVILVMSDDQGWTQTGYYGHPIADTPNLDDMANSGLRMDRFYAGAPFCVPTRATVLTGRTNARTGVLPSGAINKQEKILATAFKEAGYATGHFGKWHLSGAEDRRDTAVPASNPYNPGEYGFDYWLSKSIQFNLDPILSRNGVIEQFKGDGSEVIVDEALKFITEQSKKNKPFFVLVWYSTPHRDFEASQKDVAPYLDRTDESSALQLGELAAMDRSLGTLRQGLRDLDIDKNTLVWFTSDNGGLPDITYREDLPGVHPDTTGHLRGFKKDLYEGGIRVPTIVEWPGTIEHRVSHYPSSTIDMFLTLIDIAGLSPDSINAVNDGVSLEPVFKNEEPSRRDKPMGFRANAGRAWLDNDWKLVRNYTSGEDGPYELYNVVGDPSESNNLIDQRPDVAASMLAELEAWNASIEKSIAGLDYLETDSPEEP
ncbi:MAG: N-acetylgalactosamine 6-sulfate sulfatase [OM182 bacterium]|uniref:N-acetylgalactosamine 6-sulfate sulfatase n=1 Tax=OM182 bacterium TaxID=2510334 RepID=A0A520RXR3_9GAMM|nr:MAG: N-acetylgalactosamine 6-sulfate sulfatase [OM182 bacterium]